MASTINATPTSSGLISSADNSGVLALQTGGTTAVTVDASQNVGIGTATPSTKLTVVTGSDNGNALNIQGDTTNNVMTLTNYQMLVGRESGSNGGLTIGTKSQTWGAAGAFTAISTNGTERMRVDSSGNVLIGTTSLSFNERLSVKSVGTSSASDAVYVCNSAGTTLFRVRSDGAFQTGAASASPYNNTAAVSANCYINTDGTLLRATSSLKYKRDVQDASFGLANVLKLRSVTYKGKNEIDGEKVYGGLIAEEVDAAGLAEFVQYAEDGTPDALAYGNMVSLCVKAIQELNAKVEAQAAEIQALKGTA